MKNIGIAESIAFSSQFLFIYTKRQEQHVLFEYTLYIQIYLGAPLSHNGCIETTIRVNRMMHVG